jgi:hypothetical protein
MLTVGPDVSARSALAEFERAVHDAEMRVNFQSARLTPSARVSSDVQHAGQ